MYSLLREYPWLRPYWYATLAVIALLGVLLILWDGKTQVDRGRRRAAQLQQKERQRALKQPGTAAGPAITLHTDGGEATEGGGTTQQRRPQRKAVS